MKCLHSFKRVAGLMILMAGIVAVPLAWAGEDSEALKQAIGLYDEGNYLEAQQRLLKVNRDKLLEAEKSLRDEYLERVQIAIPMADKATKDVEDGHTALSSGKLDAAETHFKAVLDNEYAHPGLKKSAADGIDNLSRKRRETPQIHTEVVEATPPPPPPAPVTVTEVKAEEKKPQPAKPTEPVPQVKPEPVKAKPVDTIEVITIDPPPEPVTTMKEPEATKEAPVAAERIEIVEVPVESPPARPEPVQVTYAQPSQSTSDTLVVETIDLSQPQPRSSNLSTTSPIDSARAFTRQGYAALEAGDDPKARQHFESALQAVPGYPEAESGLRRMQSREEVESGTALLLNRLESRDQVNWQRTVANYRDAEREVRELVMAERYPAARQALLRARQIVEAGKQYADPVSKYEALAAELGALERYLTEEEQRFNETRVREIRGDVESTEDARREEIEDARRRQIDDLMNQAIMLRKDGDYAGAIHLLEQVVAIEPTNQHAASLLDSFHDAYSMSRQRRSSDEQKRQAQHIMTDVEDSKIPWYKELQYPKNWLEIISRSDTRAASGRERLTPKEAALQLKLEDDYGVNFDDVPFEEAIDKMADDRNININVIWRDLEASGIERDAPISLALSEVSFRRALDEMLDIVGGSEVDISYTSSGGILKIATRQFLDRDVFQEVYDIKDLLQPVRNFTDGPQIQIDQQNQGGGQGQGGIGASTGQLFGDDDDEEQEEDEGERDARVEEILALIRDTIQRETWVDNGGLRASIAEFNGQLVVTQTASAQQEIKDLLSQLREQSAIQVAVESIFLQINSNYLEELGLDLDVVLNQGNAGYDQLGVVDSVTGSQLLLPRSFSRTGFVPGVPGVGQGLTQTGFTETGGAVGVPGQPYNNPALVPPRSSSFIQSSRATPIPIVSNLLDIVAPQSTDVEGSFGGSDFDPAVNIFGSFLDNLQVDFLLRATQADRRSSVLSAPRIMVTNGQRGWIGVVTQQAYVSTLQPVLDENAAAVQPIIGVIETGAVLDVEATVSANKHYVTLTLRPGVGRLIGDVPLFPFGLSAGGAGFAGFIQTPTVQRQILKTTVTVPDGGTLLFGGLKLAAEVEVEAGAPILSKIPVLKRLYSARSLVKDESVLLILVKPRIFIQREQEIEHFPTLAGR